LRGRRHDHLAINTHGVKVAQPLGKAVIQPVETATAIDVLLLVDASGLGIGEERKRDTRNVEMWGNQRGRGRHANMGVDIDRRAARPQLTTRLAMVARCSRAVGMDSGQVVTPRLRDDGEDRNGKCRRGHAAAGVDPAAENWWQPHVNQTGPRVHGAANTRKTLSTTTKIIGRSAIARDARPFSSLDARPMPTMAKSEQGSGVFQLEEATIADLHHAIRSGLTTCVAVVQHYIDRVRAFNGVSSMLVTEDGAAVPPAQGPVRAQAPIGFPTTSKGIDAATRSRQVPRATA